MRVAVLSRSNRLVEGVEEYLRRFLVAAAVAGNGVRLLTGFVGSSMRCVMRPRNVFLISQFIYILTFSGHLTSGDGASKIAWSRAILERGSSDIDPGPAVAHSKYGVGHTLLAIPSVALAEFVRSFTGFRCFGVIYCFTFILNGSWFLALVARYLGENYPPKRVAAVVAILGLATTWWPYTKLDFSETLVLTFLFNGFLKVRDGRLFLGMMVAGLAATIRQDAALLVVVLAAWHLATTGQFHSTPIMVAGLLPALLINLAANYARYGSFRDLGYGTEAFNNPMMVGMYGILFSAGKSVFLFSPPLVLGFLGFGRFLKADRGCRDGWFFLAVFLCELFLYSKWWDWSGDDSWGCRFMIPGVMLMTLPLVEVLHLRCIVAALTSMGICIQLLAVLIGPLDFILMVRANRMERIPLYVNGTPHRVDIEDLRYNPQYSQIVGNWVMLRTLLGIPPQPQHNSEDTLVGTSLYDTVAPETWRRRRSLRSVHCDSLQSMD